jgi:guanylate kinase
VAGEFYGTPRAFLDRSLRARRDVVLDIDVQGCAKVRRDPRYRGRAVTVFVLPPGRKVLERRLRNRRTDDEGRIRRRLELAEREIARAGGYDYLVINDRLGPAVEDLAAICRAEHASLRRKGSRAVAFLAREWRRPGITG